MGLTLDALRPIHAFLRGGVVTDDDARELSSLLAPLVGTDAIAILQGPIGAADWTFHQDVPESWLTDYEQHAKEDPGIPAVMRAPPGTWYFGERTIDDEIRHSAFIEDFHDASLKDVAIARLYSPFDDDLVLVLYRGRGREPFGADEAFVLELLYPHLASALASRRGLAMGRDPNAATVDIAFPRGEVDVPDRTWRFLERRLGPIGRDGRAKIERAILAATRRFTSANAGGRSQRILPDLRLELAALPPGRGESARLRGTFLDERGWRGKAEAMSPIEALLSPRERTVARLAATGASVATIAERERVGPETVRSHLRSVYRKLGVHSRVELAHALRQA